jgi:hypothetical protein
MEQDLNQYRAENPCKGFNPVPHYFPAGDYVTFYVRDEQCHAEQVDDLLTVFLANDTGEMVGCKVKGVKRLLSEMGSFGVTVQNDNVFLELFFLLGRSAARDSVQRRRYDQVIPLAKGRSVNRREILGAAS